MGAASDPGSQFQQQGSLLQQQQQRHTVAGSFTDISSSGGWFSRGNSSLSTAAAGIPSSSSFSSPGYRAPAEAYAREMDSSRARPSSISINLSNPESGYFKQQQHSMSAGGGIGSFTSRGARPYSQSALQLSQQERPSQTPFAEGYLDYTSSTKGDMPSGFRAASASGMRPISPSPSSRNYLEAQLSRLSSVSRAGSYSVGPGSFSGAGRGAQVVGPMASPGAFLQQQQHRQQATDPSEYHTSVNRQQQFVDQTEAQPTAGAAGYPRDIVYGSAAAEGGTGPASPAGSVQWVAQSPPPTAPPGGGIGSWVSHGRTSPSNLGSPRAAAASAPGGLVQGPSQATAARGGANVGFELEDSAEQVWVPGVNLQGSRQQQQRIVQSGPQQQQHQEEDGPLLLAQRGHSSLPARISPKQVPVQGIQRPSWSAATTPKGSKLALSSSSGLEQQQQQQGGVGVYSSPGGPRQAHELSTGGHVRFTEASNPGMVFSGADSYFHDTGAAAGGTAGGHRGGGGANCSSAVSSIVAHAGSSTRSSFCYSSYNNPELEQFGQREPGSLIIGDPPMPSTADVILEVNYSRGSSVGLEEGETEGPQEALHQYLLGRFKRLQQGRLMQKVLTAWWAYAVEDKLNRETAAGKR